MMRSGNPSHLGAAVRLVVSGVRRRGTRPRPGRLEPGRKVAVERNRIELSAARVGRYLAATGGEAAYPLQGADPEITPTYSGVWETALTLELLAQDGLAFPARGVVHLGSEVVVLRPVRLNDRVRARLELARLEAHSRGAALVLEHRVWNAAGQLCQQNETRLLLPGTEAPRGAPRVPRGEAGGAEEEAAGAGWREIASWALRGDAGIRYARASGDFNPIHLWPWSARILGFSRPILHGHCILSMMSHALSAVTGHHTRKISARFRGPVELPAAVRLEEAGGSVRLMDGGKRLVEGRWVGREMPAS